MKIVTPLTDVDCYEPLMKAGADEFYCGIVPYQWLEKYNNSMPINRREFIYTGNICNISSMKILKKKVDKYGIPIKITFNSLYYIEEQYPLLLSIIQQLIAIGFNTFIIADVALIVYLREKGIKCNIHLSGETADINEWSIDFFHQFHVSRFVFTRKNTLMDMKECIESCYQQGIEFEAFVLNGLCTFSSAFCNTLHCDEMCSACFIPYHIEQKNKGSIKFSRALRLIEISNTVSQERLKDKKQFDKLGATGCGLCRIKDLLDAGVTHLKIVGRGSSLEALIDDVKKTKEIIDEAMRQRENIRFARDIKEKYRHNKCPAACLYPMSLSDYTKGEDVL